MPGDQAGDFLTYTPAITPQRTQTVTSQAQDDALDVAFDRVHATLKAKFGGTIVVGAVTITGNDPPP